MCISLNVRRTAARTNTPYNRKGKKKAKRKPTIEGTNERKGKRIGGMNYLRNELGQNKQQTNSQKQKHTTAANKQGGKR